MLVERTLSATQTVHALSHVYRGPWLMHRVVELGAADGKPAARGSMEITENNPFMDMHPHGFPGVMTAEFTQQLGFLMISETLGIKELPYMLGLEVKSKKPVRPGDIIIATVIHTEVKRGSFYHFEASVKNQHGATVMKTAFYGTPVKENSE